MSNFALKKQVVLIELSFTVQNEGVCVCGGYEHSGPAALFSV